MLDRRSSLRAMSDKRINKYVPSLCQGLAYAMGIGLEAVHLIPMYPGKQVDYFRIVPCACRTCCNPQNWDLVTPWSTVCECYNLVRLIRRVELTRDAADISEDQAWKDAPVCAEEKAEAFVEWIKQNGGDTSKVTLKLNKEKTAFQVWTTQPIEEQEVVFSFPSKLVMSAEFAENVRKILPMEPISENHMTQISEEQVVRADIMRLALFIIYEKYVRGQKSFWKPLLDVLPRLESYTVLSTYSLKDLELLKGCRNGLREAWLGVKSMFGEYIFIHHLFDKHLKSKLLKDLKQVITLRRYMWARARADVRRFRRPSKATTWNSALEEARIYGIFPMLDMIPFQGSEPRSIRHSKGTSPENKDIFACIASANLESDFPLSILVEKEHSNSYYSSHGWLPGNFPVEDEEYNLVLAISKADTNFDRKARIIDRMNMGSPEAIGLSAKLFLCDLESKDSQEKFDNIISYVRVIQGNEELLDQVDSIGTGFLTEPRRESWVFLSDRFMILEKGAQKTVDNILLKLNIGKDEMHTLSKKCHAMVQYMIMEQATLACLVQATTKRIDSEDF